MLASVSGVRFVVSMTSIRIQLGIRLFWLRSRYIIAV